MFAMPCTIRQSTPGQAFVFARQGTKVPSLSCHAGASPKRRAAAKRARAAPGPQKRRAGAPLQTRKRVPTRPHHSAGESTLLESLLEDFVSFLVFLSSFFFG